jgi:glycosyltransferase involved in cell wall biosynthesis
VTHSDEPTGGGHGVTVILTVRNDAQGAAVTVESLLKQTRKPDEIVVVDGGSTDATRSVLEDYARRDDVTRIIDAPGANIAAGRNLATSAANHPIIAGIDGGCRANPDWLEQLLRPFEDDPSTEFVAGLYRIEPQSLLEHVVGLATMRGQIEPVDPKRFNASGRSIAYTKNLWRRAGGWPDWIRYAEDTLFNHRIRAVTGHRRLAERAIVHWRPRGSIAAIAKQFFCYGTGRGHTQIDAASFRYNLRNVALVVVAACACAWTWYLAPLLIALLAYFYVWTFHGKAVRLVEHTGRWQAYPLTLCVMWTVLFSNLAGYLVGSWQRFRNPGTYKERMNAFLGRTCSHAI